MTALVHTPFSQALGWTLVHSLWEGALLALLLWMALSLTPTARLRYNSACLVLLGLLAAFGVTFWLSFPTTANAVVALPAPPRPGTDGMPMAAAEATGFRVADTPPRLAPFWLAGVLLWQLRTLVGWLALRRLRTHGVCPAPDYWRQHLEQLQSKMRVSRPVVLLESGLARVPMMMGHLRPVILLPAGLLAGMPIEQMEAILLHELAHVRRLDYLANFLQCIVESLLFYHPAVWWMSRVIRAERENACDDLVVATQGAAYVYANALASLEESRGSINHAALAASGGSLMQRIHRLLYPAQASRSSFAPLLSTIVVALAATGVLVAWQSPAPQALAQPGVSSEQVEVVKLRAQVAELERRLAAQHQQFQQFQRSEVDALRDEVDALRAKRDLLGQTYTPEHPEMRRVQERIQLAERATRDAYVAQNSTSSTYDHWLNEEVVYIIQDSERQAFKKLNSDYERQRFVADFWQRRDPLPNTPENEFKEEHYRRISYANERFGSPSGMGWRSDRGRIYITFGPPDEIESHPIGHPGKKDYPFDIWLYNSIPGVGTRVIMEFADPKHEGEMRMTKDPNA